MGSSTCWFTSGCLQEPGLTQLKSRSQELLLGLPRAQQGPKDFEPHLLPPRVYTSKELGQEQILDVKPSSALTHIPSRRGFRGFWYLLPIPFEHREQGDKQSLLLELENEGHGLDRERG